MLNTYTVIMLGPRGSGKTVFLASMYKKLSTQGKLGFFLEVDSAEKRKRLKNVYTELALGEKWPKGTQVAELSEWIFTCKVQTPDLPIYSACNFAYLDYAGGLLTDEQEDSNIGIELEEKIKDADALIGLLDGQRLCELIRGESSGVRWSINDLTNILDIMQTSEKPIHFIVSKWDVVEGNYSLEEIKKRLLEIEEFRNVVETRNQAGTPVRLIPVSSVGMGFAVLQPDGRMEKKVEILPQPYQIEMPLACILPDMIKVKLEELMKTREQEERQIVKVQANLSFWDKLTKFIGGTSKAIIESVQELLPKKISVCNRFNRRFYWFY